MSCSKPLSRMATVALMLAAVLLSGCTQRETPLSQLVEEKKGTYPIRTKHLEETGAPKFTNALIRENSIYLLQHAHNPVNWHAWNEQSLQLARDSNKPILLSIGYSSCHWCHVMERESFENLEVAALINQYFVPIKVDREERPDIDELYLTSVQLLTEKAGWPLTAILTPEGVPFTGGTYFSRDQFTLLLERAHFAWSTQQALILEQAAVIKSSIEALNSQTGSSEMLNKQELDRAIKSLVEGLGSDPINSSAFPREPEILSVLKNAVLFPEKIAVQAISDRLKKLANSGLHDQLGGGFHRYSVDDHFAVPHFEKMLYNQAQLAQAYYLDYLLTGNERSRLVGESTLNFMLQEMASPNGGFVATLDAESDGAEGAFYVWTTEQLTALFEPEQMKFVSQLFGLTPGGNFIGNHSLQFNAALAASAPQQTAQVVARLRAQRATRNRPAADRQRITAWNALSISALLSAYTATANNAYLERALATARLFLSKALMNDMLLRNIPESSSVVPGVLSDYANFGNALLDLYDTTSDRYWLEQSNTVAALMLEHFFSQSTGRFHNSSNKTSATSVIVNLTSARDDAMVSGVSMASQLMARLYHRTANPQFRTVARQVIGNFSDGLRNNPQNISGLLLAATILQDGEASRTVHAAKAKVTLRPKVQGSKLIIDISIDQGWHINGFQTLEDYLIPTRLRGVTSSCASTALVDYPPAKTVTLGFNDAPLLVYDGEVQLIADLSAAPGICRLAVVDVDLQTCSDEVCLEPATVRIALPNIPSNNE